MKTEDLYKAKNTCCGCELCAQSCPKSIIKMVEDEEGFLYPQIEDDTKCINCGKCLSVCPEKTPGRPGNPIIKSYSFHLSNNNDLKKSASGGLVTAISREFIRLGGVVYGVGYSDDFRSIRYARASEEMELEQFRGSKYVQANKRDIYLQVKRDLNEGLKVLFVGLPCEISALYHATGEKDNLYSISLICHGPTSQKVHRDYCDSLPNNGKAPLTFFSVRYKKKGWKPYYIQANYDDGKEYSEVWGPSDYGMAFLYLKRPSCRTCQYKAENMDFGLQADLVAGDFHGVNKKSKEYHPWGVSEGCILTKKGIYLSSLAESECNLTEIPYSVVRNTNRGLFMPIPQRGNKERFVNDYLNHSLHYACHSWMVKTFNMFVSLNNKIKRFRSVKKIPAKINSMLNR